MSLFQHSVLNKYLKESNQEEMKLAYQKLVTYFHNPTIQQNIRESKEEQFQEGFLRELFVSVLGYTIKPHPEYNLTTEFKNERGAKKADGAILIEGSAIGVIELKSTKTKDLEAIRLQAFDYKANQQKCVYIITSNFEKIRFYINNAVEFEEFDLFRLEYEHFQLFWLCLAKENLLKGIPLAIKEASIIKEENITKKIYIDYSLFKHELYNDLIRNNLTLDIFSGKDEKEIKLTLFQKSQKLLDRFLFIFFGEDRGLLPPNSISEIIKQWENQSDWGDEIKLYDRYKKYFHLLNTGWKGKNYEIFKYNGGLFAPDEILDKLLINNELLKKHTKNLSGYDFETEVDVNILGHIFENSLNDIEEITAQIEGVENDLKKSKRKKDGVFYTPKYITKYIVENTVGKLCAEKRKESGIDEIDFSKSYILKTPRIVEIETKVHAGKRLVKRKTSLSVEGFKHLENLEEYRNFLLGLSILDPACGSGAFLNQALDFLIKEHGFVTEQVQKITGDVSTMFIDIENQILENNIFGVDINEESVEIAKLSLWLRTAQKGRKLTTLSDNIKCGNSLIDDPEIAGEKAFNWQNEFPEVFKNGGFDVVIGNPPYLRVQGLRENFEIESKYYENHFDSATGRFDIYVLFIEKSYSLIKSNGVVSFILPHKFLVSDFGEGIRKFLVLKKAINSILHFGAEMVFSDASTYTCIINLSSNNLYLNFKRILPEKILDPIVFEQMDYKLLSNEKWNLKNTKIEKLFNKLYSQPFTVKDIFESISQGIVSVGDEIFLMQGKIEGDKFIGFSEKIGKEVILEAKIVKPILKGEDVKKYMPLKINYYCLYPHYEYNGKTVPYEEDYFKQNFPLAFNYMLPFKDELIEKKVRYKTNPKAWYSLHRSREMSLFEQEKIITPEISLGTNMVIDSKMYYHNTKCYTLAKRKDIPEDYRYWIAILNSKLLWFFLSSTGYVLRGGFFTFKTKYLEPFPLPKLDKLDQQNPIIEKVDLIMLRTIDFNKSKDNLVKYLQSQFSIESLNNKLQNWHDLVFGEFIIELNKAIKKTGSKELSKIQEMEWMEVFENKKAEAQTIKIEIDQTDREIDQMVYELYGLTEEEIRIVEGN